MPWWSVEILPYAIGRTEDDREFHIAEKAALSSLLLPNLDFLDSGWNVKQTVRLNTVGLDDLCAQCVLNGQFDFLKVDVQGADLEVIKSGAEYLLPDLLGIEVEASFREHYLTQPFFSEIEIYLREKGFELLIISQHHAPPDYNSPIAGELDLSRQRVDWCDAVFLRGKAWLQNVEEVRRGEVLPKLVVIYMVYGLFEDAFVLANEFDADLGDAVLRYYEQETHRGWRWRLGVLRRAFWSAVKPSRQNRARLARHAVTYNRSSEGHSWKLIDLFL
jgi:FkbM family methyltransferase